MTDRVVIGGDLKLKNTIDGQAQSVITHGGGTNDHNVLINRDLPEQHPISAITGLTEALAAKPDSLSLSAIAFSGALSDADPDDMAILDCGSSTEVI